MGNDHGENQERRGTEKTNNNLAVGLEVDAQTEKAIITHTLKSQSPTFFES